MKSGVPQGSVLGPLLFLVYINDITAKVSFSDILLFVDETQCIAEVCSPDDCLSLQSDLDSVLEWSNDWNMHFNHIKSVHMRFGSGLPSFSYSLGSNTIQTSSSHSDLGILLSTSLSWSPHISNILSKAYKSLGLIKRTVPYNSNILLKKSLYLLLCRSYMAYCPQIWRPHLTQDSRAIERLQRRATKYILTPCLDYKSRLVNLSILPLTLWLEFLDILLLIKLLKDPPDNFQLDQYINLVSSSIVTRSSSSLKLCTVDSHAPRLNTTRHFYFNRVTRLWNHLPPLDLNLSIASLKHQIHDLFWNYFLVNYDTEIPCTWYISCPCNTCLSTITPNPTTYTRLNQKMVTVLHR